MIASLPMRYRVIVSGENAWLSEVAKAPFGRRERIPRLCGFATTRVVTADNAAAASELAIEAARQELLPLVSNDSSDPPRFEVDPADVEELDGDAPVSAPRGFTFYLQEPPLSS